MRDGQEWCVVAFGPLSSFTSLHSDMSPYYLQILAGVDENFLTVMSSALTAYCMRLSLLVA